MRSALHSLKPPPALIKGLATTTIYLTATATLYSLTLHHHHIKLLLVIERFGLYGYLTRNKQFKFSRDAIAKLPAPTHTDRVDYQDTEVLGLQLLVSKTGRKVYKVKIKKMAER